MRTVRWILFGNFVAVTLIAPCEPAARALLLNRSFQMPGLGSLMVEAIHNNDRAVEMGLTHVLSIAYCRLLLVTDVCDALVDPRVRLR